MSIDIIIVNFHSAHLLPNCIAEAKKFGGTSAKLYLVDNSPNDGGLVQALKTVPDATTIINEHNKGFAAAVNQAINQSSGEFILLLNPDILNIKGRFNDVQKIFKGNESIAAIGVRLLNSDGTLQLSCRRTPRLLDFIPVPASIAARFCPWWDRRSFNLADWDYSSVRTVDVACGGFLLIRRQAFEVVGLLDESFFVYYEETDWLVRAKKKGWRTVFYPGVEAVHNANSSSAGFDETMPLLLIESQLTYASKHFGWFRAAVLRWALFCIDVLRLLRQLIFAKKSADRTDQIKERIKVYVTGKAKHER